MSETFAKQFIANPVQQGFIESRAAADLFASRVGEGKSTALAWSAYYHTRHNPGAKWVFVRDTYENMKRTTLDSFFQWFPPGVMGTFHITDKKFTWASGVAQGDVFFIGMDNPDDASKLLSWELAGIAMDEPAPAVGSAGIDEMVFDLGLTRLRQPNMQWYSMKLATNNPDEQHWTYRKFTGDDARERNYQLWQPHKPENIQNLPEGYYERVRSSLKHRPDLVRRFVDGEFGYQQEGKAVTPQWSDRIHLTMGLSPIPRRETILLWDFGHNPTCIVTQISPQGYWMILDSFVGEGIGVEELIEGAVKPLLASRYAKSPLRHIGDPAGATGDQSSINRSAVRSIRKTLGGTWRPGPVKWHERRDPLQAVLAKTIGGTGLVQVDRHRATEVWHALRGGYHYHVTRTGIVSATPEKNIHSHPGDAMGYGAAILFPMGRLQRMPDSFGQTPTEPRYWGHNAEPQGGEWRIGPKGPQNLPNHGEPLRMVGSGWLNK